MNTTTTIINLLHLKRVGIFLLTFLFYTTSLFGSPMTISINQHSICENSEILVPVNVSAFNDVKAISLYINIDTLLLSYQGLANPHPQLQGGTLISNLIIQNGTPTIIIIWQRMSAMNLNSGKLFDLSFFYRGDTASLHFANNCEIGLSDLSVANATFIDGAVVPLSIEDQPQNTSVTQGETAEFLVSLLDDAQYQWQQFHNDAWINLSNTLPFSGVNTHKLTISNVTLSLNDYFFRCIIVMVNCQLISNEAKLSVGTLNAGHILNIEPKLTVFPIPFDGLLHLRANQFITNVNIEIFDLFGVKHYLIEKKSWNIGEVETISVNLPHSGMYLMRVMSNKDLLSTIQVLKQ